MDGHFSHERKSGDSREVASFTTKVAKDTKSFVGAAVEGLRAAQKDFVFYDISGLLSNELTSLYTDRVHYTDQGATVVAEAVVDRIKPLIEKKLYEKPRTVDARQPLKESLCRERNGRPTFNAQ